jgi:hypothetical protein
VRTELVQDLASALPRPGSAEPGQSFQDELSHVIDMLKRRREWRQLLLLEFVTYAARNPRFRARFAADRQKFKHALADVLAERIAAHHLQPVAPPEQLAILVTALVNGLAFDELTEPDVVSTDLLATGLTALMDQTQQPGKLQRPNLLFLDTGPGTCPVPPASSSRPAAAGGVQAGPRGPGAASRCVWLRAARRRQRRKPGLLAGRAPSGGIAPGAGWRAGRVRWVLPSGHGRGELPMNRALAARLCSVRGYAPGPEQRRCDGRLIR